MTVSDMRKGKTQFKELNLNSVVNLYDCKFTKLTWST